MCNGRSKSLDGPEGPQDGSRIAQDGSRMAPRWPKLLRMGPGWLQDGSVRAFIRSLRLSEALRLSLTWDFRNFERNSTRSSEDNSAYYSSLSQKISRAVAAQFSEDS